jgi:hypothetical protein
MYPACKFPLYSDSLLILNWEWTRRLSGLSMNAMFTVNEWRLKAWPNGDLSAPDMGHDSGQSTEASRMKIGV